MDQNKQWNAEVNEKKKIQSLEDGLNNIKYDELDKVLTERQ